MSDCSKKYVKSCQIESLVYKPQMSLNYQRMPTWPKKKNIPYKLSDRTHLQNPNPVRRIVALEFGISWNNNNNKHINKDRKKEIRMVGRCFLWGTQWGSTCRFKTGTKVKCACDQSTRVNNQNCRVSDIHTLFLIKSCSFNYESCIVTKENRKKQNQMTMMMRMMMMLFSTAYV